MSLTVNPAILDLTTLARVKAWMAITNTSSDDVLQMAITTVSAQIMAYLERGSFIFREYKDFFDGQGNYLQATDRYPIIDVLQVVIDDQIIPESPMNTPGNTQSSTPGWVVEVWDGLPPGHPQYIELIGYKFTRRRQNVFIDYTAGYYTRDEAQVVAPVPASGTPTVGAFSIDQQYGINIATDKLVYQDTKVPLVKTSDSPGVGQYAPDPSNPASFTVNVADVGRTILTSYSWCPYAVEEICWEMVNEAFSRRGRPGQHSRGLVGQETAQYDLSGMSNHAIDVLQAFRSIIPL